MRNTLQRYWLVRWIILLPPQPRLDRKIVRMPDSHSRAVSILLFHSTPLSSSLLTSATQTTRLCCKQHTCWLHSPSGPAPSLAQRSEQKCMQVCLQPGHTQSRSYSNCSIYFALARGRKEERLQNSQWLLITNIKVTRIMHINVSLFHTAG